MFSNRYSHLSTDFNIETSNSSGNPIKKALKKLREIQLLEDKPCLSQEEIKKISEKSKWERILPSFIPEPTHNNSEIPKSKQKLKREKIKLQLEKQKKAKYKYFKATTFEELEREWNYSVSNVYNNDVLKTFRFMSIKYHPDKQHNNNDELQKHLGSLRDRNISY